MVAVSINLFIYHYINRYDLQSILICFIATVLWALPRHHDIESSPSCIVNIDFQRTLYKYYNKNFL